MRFNKILTALAALTVLAGASNAQSGTYSIHLEAIGINLSDPDDVSTLTPLGASAPNTLTLDINSDFGGSNIFYVKVTARFRLTQHDPNVWRGASLLNSYINLAGTGLTIYDGFTADEVGNDSDPRKNVNSHSGGNSSTDCAANSGLIDNSARAWDATAPGGPLAGQPAAVGKSIYTTPRTSLTSVALYSFVIKVPRQLGTYNVSFDRIFSGPPANTDATVKTNVLGNSPTGEPVQAILEVINGRIDVVPEPASMIALGTGLAGLLALRRRRK